MLDTRRLLETLMQLQTGGQGGPPATTGAKGTDVLTGAQQALGGLTGALGKGLGGSGLAGGALAGGITALLLGTKAGRKLGSTAIKVGGLALLGGLAYKAYSDWQAGRTAVPAQQQQPPAPLPPPESSGFAVPATPEGQNVLARAVIRAMIAAARADGRIDAEETRKVEQALAQAGLADGARTFLIEALGQPDDLDDIARQATTPELAAEMWLAARLTIDPDTAEEAAFLRTFAERLRLAPDLVAHLEATAAAAR